MNLPKDANELTFWLALWGAATGSVTWLIGIRNYLIDRPRVRMWLSAISEEEVDQLLGTQMSSGEGEHYLVEVVNVGHRSVSTYQPEMWVLNPIKLLDYMAPSYVYIDGAWKRVEKSWDTYSLKEGDTITFVFRLIKGDRFARIDLADTMRRFTHCRTIRGTLRLLYGRFRTKGAEYRKLRDAFARRDRPRHFKEG
jgi:hypothetical protein